MLNLEQVSDPTDFENGHLRVLDAVFRCPICKEFFTGPVLLRGCGHSFCSLCVREVLPSKEECPSCRTPSTEGHLLKNVVLEEAVMAYITARGDILSLATASSSPRKRKRSQDGNLPVTSKRRIDREDGDVSQDECGELRTPRQAGKQKEIVDVDQYSDSDFPQSPANLGVEMVVCPICDRKVPSHIINEHLDRGCASPTKLEVSKAKATSARAWKDLLAGQLPSSSSRPKSKDLAKLNVAETQKPLPSVAYAMWNIKQFRKELEELGLDSTGDKATLEARHARWTTIWNANLDSSKPLGTKELKRELRKWEQDKLKAKTREKVAIEDTEAWEKSNHHQFASLVKLARGTKDAAKIPSTTHSPASSRRPEQVISVDSDA